MTKYCAWYDKDDDIVIVAFGSDAEIEDDCLCYEYDDEEEVAQLGEILKDTGSLCEDYAIQPRELNRASDVPAIEKIVENFSCFVKDERLINCGWG